MNANLKQESKEPSLREIRAAAALRENLRRRKQQDQARAEKKEKQKDQK